MVTVQSLLWPGADDDRWFCGDEYLTEHFRSLFLFSSHHFPKFEFLSTFCLSVCLCPLLLFLPQSLACPTSQLPQEPSSPQITQRATGTTWTASGLSNQIRAPESTWHLMTSTSRPPMMLWQSKMARQTTPSSSGGSLALRVLPISHPIPTRCGWSFRLITPCQDEDLISHTAVCHFIIFDFLPLCYINTEELPISIDIIPEWPESWFKPWVCYMVMAGKRRSFMVILILFAAE